MSDGEPARRPRRHRRATRAGTGTPMPGQTTDDTDEGWGEAARPGPRRSRPAGDGDEARDQHEQWLLDQRPPHWD